ncbi:hypothetical protein I546_6707 [Mycobacterium kansasii 732]|nr:hypothetical protein I546_6707 [Mycobacterium kansasii 732]
MRFILTPPLQREVHSQVDIGRSNTDLDFRDSMARWDRYRLETPSGRRC